MGASPTASDVPSLLVSRVGEASGLRLLRAMGEETKRCCFLCVGGSWRHPRWWRLSLPQLAGGRRKGWLC
jgi:hypothetical protein